MSSSSLHGTHLSSTSSNGGSTINIRGSSEKRKSISSHHHLGVNSGSGNGGAASGTNAVTGIGGSNKKERRRTQSINNAFASLRDCIPNVPTDTKLSKIKTLRLATSYIDYLMQVSIKCTFEIQFKICKILVLCFCNRYSNCDSLKVLDSPNGDPEHNSTAIEGFKADIHKRWNEKTEEQKRRELVSTQTVY